MLYPVELRGHFKATYFSKASQSLPVAKTDFKFEDQIRLEKVRLAQSPIFAGTQPLPAPTLTHHPYLEF